MLVLSRRSNERVLFPTLDVAVQVLQVVKSNTVRLGIEAPPEVPVLRGELSAGAERLRPAAEAEREKAHALCNRLSKVTLSIHLFERQWQAGRHDEARATLAGVLDSLGDMDRAWVLEQFKAPRTPPPRYRTLVVEDDSNQRELLAGLLRMNGCDCATAADGDAALDYLAAHERPDVLLVDMWMPRCDGPGTIRRVRSDPRYNGMKVFSISSTSPQEAGLPTGPEGVDVWFPKPLNPGKLWDTIRAAVAN